MKNGSSVNTSWIWQDLFKLARREWNEDQDMRINDNQNILRSMYDGNNNYYPNAVNMRWLDVELYQNAEAVAQVCSVKKVLLDIEFTGKQLCQSLFFNKVAGLQALDLRPATISKKRLRRRLFPCEFCEIFKNTFFIEHLRWLLLKWRQVLYWNSHSVLASF